MDTTHLPTDFKEFLRLLNDARVEYLLIGGYAVGYHGYPRATTDIDVWIARDPANAAKVAETLHRFGFSPTAISANDLMKENQLFRFGIPPLRIEIPYGNFRGRFRRVLSSPR